MNSQHSSKTDNWGTPQNIIDLSRQVLGHIDLDPTSSPEHNERVMASRIITKEEDGLFTDWINSKPISIFINPPGGKRHNVSNTKLFWRRLMDYRERGLVIHAIFICFSIEAAQTTQNGCTKTILDFPVCVPKKRLKFIDATENRSSPTHSNAIVYVPGIIDQSHAFNNAFQSVGKVMIPFFY